MTLWMLLKEAEEKLNRCSVPEGDYDARELLFQAFGLTSADYLLHKHEELETLYSEADRKEKLVAFQGYIEKRSHRIPLQQILGACDFYGLTFRVTDQVLCPRQDTELLVETVLQDYKNADLSDISVLDLCTGSGCIGITLQKLGGFPQMTLVDLSEEALQVAKDNAEHILEIRLEEADEGWCDAGTRARIKRGPVGEAAFPAAQRNAGIVTGTSRERSLRLLHADLFSAVAEEKFSVIVSNPPYIPTQDIQELEPEVRDHEPRMALDGTEDGLAFYRRITEEAPRHLTPGGRLYVEIGYDQGTAVRTLFRTTGFQDIILYQDYHGHDRVVVGTWGD